MRFKLGAIKQRYHIRHRNVLPESRPGWLSLDLPPLEVWAEPLKQLSVPQRKRVETPEFYQLLQREVTRRYLARSRSPG